MAKEVSMCLLFLSFLIICCSGTLLGFSFGTATSAENTFSKKNKTSQSQIQFSCFFCAISSILSQSKVHIRRILDDTTNNSPTSTTPIITPPYSPANITVPSTNPVPLTPTNPANSPATPNPVTSIPPPLNAATIPGQSWCVAKTGVPETTLQSALDYCCGLDSAACSQIQQGGSCYNPNSLQNHASVAFNSYYHKNPAPTSCDFGGAATLVNTNPSSGSCIYTPSSASSSGAGAGISNSGAPTSVFGSQSPPPEGVGTSHSADLRPFIGCMVMLISLVTGSLNMRQ